MTQQLSPYKSWGKYFALAFLFITFTYNLLARYLIVFQYSLPLSEDLTPDEREYQSIKEALGITSSQYGLLTGPAFMGVFALFNLFSGFVADNFNRKITMSIGLALTSLSIGLTYFVNSFYQLFLLRSLLALGQAFYAPLGYSIIAVYFPDYKTTANAIFASGVYAGYGLASLALLLLPLPHVGWRNLSLYIAIAGACISTLFVFIVREPVRTQQLVEVEEPNGDNQAIADPEDAKSSSSSQASTLPPVTQYSWFQSVKISLSSPHVLALIAILIPRLSGGGVLGAFFPLLMKTRFPSMKTKFAGMNAIVVSSGGILSSLLGGIITDKWVAMAKKQDELREFEQNLLSEGDYDYTVDNVNHTDDTTINSLKQPAQSKPPKLGPYLYIAALSCLISLGAFAAVFTVGNIYAAMGLLFIAYLFSECYFAPLLSVFYSTPTLPMNVRSTALSVSLGISQLIASSAPVIVGYFDDKYNDVQSELLLGVLVPNAVAGLISLTTGCIVG